MGSSGMPSKGRAGVTLICFALIGLGFISCVTHAELSITRITLTLLCTVGAGALFASSLPQPTRTGAQAGKKNGPQTWAMISPLVFIIGITIAFLLRQSGPAWALAGFGFAGGILLYVGIRALLFSEDY